VHLDEPLTRLPFELNAFNIVLKNGGSEIEYTFDAGEEGTGIPALLRRIGELGIGYRDLQTRQSSLEDIFVDLVSEKA
jgi:ABC-2 type transport system ATP-binding protein